MPFKAFRLMFKRNAPLHINPLRKDPALWHWCWRFLNNCTRQRYNENFERALRVAVYSRFILKALRQRHNLKYDQSTGGILYVYRDRSALAGARDTAARLSDIGYHQRILSGEGVIEEEPALARSRDPIIGGIHSPDDETGDALAFSLALEDISRRSGVEFEFDTTITSLSVSQGRVCSVNTQTGPVEADAYVLCLGSETGRLLAPTGLKLPIYPAKGYSITAPIKDMDAAPKRSITDEDRFIVVTRLGDRIRAAGTAELAGWNQSINPSRLPPIRCGAEALFPDAADYNALTPWCGLRPATPDSVPIIGPTRLENLFVNAGHGTLGWTMACGSARIITDLLSGRTPEIDLDGLTPARFSV